jgi:hypothetical protein
MYRLPVATLAAVRSSVEYVTRDLDDAIDASLSLLRAGFLRDLGNLSRYIADRAAIVEVSDMVRLQHDYSAHDAIAILTYAIRHDLIPTCDGPALRRACGQVAREAIRVSASDARRARAGDRPTWGPGVDPVRRMARLLRDAAATTDGKPGALARTA